MYSKLKTNTVWESMFATCAGTFMTPQKVIPKAALLPEHRLKTSPLTGYARFAA